MYELTIWCWLRIKWFLFRVLKIRFHERSTDKMYQVIEITIQSSHKEKSGCLKSIERILLILWKSAMILIPKALL